jgi:adenine deaminase
MNKKREPTVRELKRRVDVAMGRGKADLLLRGGKIVDVFSGSIREEDVAILSDRIVGFGARPAHREIDVSGHFVSPGFIDGHVHMESGMVTPVQYARATTPHGTTAVVIDPHEIANVMGLKGIEWLIRAARDNPLRVFIMVPSCVPATSMETSGASISEADMEALIDHPWVLGIGEMMNFPAVTVGASHVLRKLTVSRGKRIDGHAPGLSGNALDAYVAAGITSDHECTTLDEARQKLERGMIIMIREGSSAKNLADLIPVVTPENAGRLMLVSDDRHPHDLVHEGHMDAILRKATHLGLDPITAVRMATLNPAAYFGLHDMGAVAPGYRADLVVLENLRDFHVKWLLHGGKIVVEQGTVHESAFRKKTPRLANSVHVPRIQPEALRLVARSHRVRVIDLIPGQITTRMFIETIPVNQGCALPDLKRDLLKIVVVERHHNSGRIAKAFIHGFGLREGAIGSSVSHDAHNIVVVGTNDQDMALTINEINRMRGGLVATSQGRVRASLPLPLAGLLSDRSVEEVDRALGVLQQEVQSMGSPVASPFMALSFLALPVIPKLKITDQGLVDVDAFQIVDLFV